MPDNQHITRTMTQQLAVPTPNLGVPTPLAITYQSSPARPHRKKRRAPARPPNTPSPSAPAMNTRARTAKQAQINAPPAANTRSCRQSHIPKPSTKAPSLAKRLHRVENEVHQALAVLDKPRSKFLTTDNYSPTLPITPTGRYHLPTNLDALPMALAAESKAPTPSNSSESQISLLTAAATSLTAHLSEPYDPRKKNPIARVLSLAAIASTILAKWPPRLPTCLLPRYCLTV
jgi:hypothetical protein